MDFETLYDQGWQRDDSQMLAKHHVLAAELFNGGTVLDLGCSDGLFLTLLKEKGGEGKGIDISPFIVSKAKEKGLDVEVGDITKPINLADGSYEYVSALNVIEHLFEPEAFLAEMARISSKYVIIATPNFASLPARLQVLRGRVPENNTLRKHHVVWVTWKVLRDMFERNNLRIVSVANNTFWENVPVIGSMTRFLVKVWPAMFALSFTVKAEKVEYFKRGGQVNKEEVIDYYDKIYDKGGSDAIRPISDYRKKFSYLEPVIRGRTLIDVGCGTGYILKIAEEKGLKPTGLEISPSAAALAKKVASKSNIVLGEGEELPFGDKQFDYLVCLGSLEHFNDIPKALDEMFRVTKEDAKLLIMVPNRDYLFWKITGAYGTQQIKEVLLTLPEWKELFSKHGLVVESVHQDRWAGESVGIFAAKSPIRMMRRMIFKTIWALMPLHYTYQFAFICRKK